MRTGTDTALCAHVLAHYGSRLTAEAAAFLRHTATELEVHKTKRGAWMFRNGTTHQHMMLHYVHTGKADDAVIRETFNDKGWRAACKENE
jgi:hypothetical protein